MVSLDELKQGAVLKGSRWSEPVSIDSIVDKNGFIHIKGATVHSKQYINQIIPHSELANIHVESVDLVFSEEPWKVFLSLEMLRYRFASMYDPLIAMSTSKVNPLPHQIDAVYGRILKMPRIRFLIADDPGAGKTIMAGLIIKELKIRNLVKRILVVVPGHLKDQWRREMKERFEESFTVIDRAAIDALYAENIWSKESQAITSLDFIKQEDIITSLAASDFDLVIVDEAHKLSAYQYGDKVHRTARYRVGQVLSHQSEHLIFLTATPHRGDSDNFRLFLDLLNEGFFATNELLEESIVNKDNPLFIRRIKEDLRDFDGTPLFLPRHVTTSFFSLESDDERELYNDLSQYVEHQYNRALSRDKKRNVAFALVILQRRFASSIYAVLQSLIRRKKRLNDLLEGANERITSPRSFDSDDYDEMSEEDRWKEEEIWETLSVAENRDELKDEIKTIESLIRQCQKIIDEEKEVKIKELKKALSELESIYPDKEDQKILIFTESKDTLDYLEGKIKAWGYSCNVIHGGMKLEERILAEKTFKQETQVLIATEAAGEGINLQFCHLMINYDLPWNPNRLEQRMGRVHRYGQRKEVYIINLVAEDTREGKVFAALLRKLEDIKGALGPDKVFDCLGDLMYETNLSQILTEVAANARDVNEVIAEMTRALDDDYVAGVKESLSESLATRNIDYTQIKELEIKAREQRLIPEYTEHFFRKAIEKAGGKIIDRKDGMLSMESIPLAIRRISKDDSFRKSFGELLKAYRKFTFDKSEAFKNPDAEFVSLGHPLFEAVMAWVKDNFNDVIRNGAVFVDPDGEMDGYVLFYEGEISDGKGEVAGKRLFAIYNDDDVVRPVSPSFIWDMEYGKAPDHVNIDIESLKDSSNMKIITSLQEYLEELLTERVRQSDIKEKYGINSLDFLIDRLDGELIDLYERRDNGENVDLPIHNKEERLENYRTARKDLHNLIEKEKSLTMSMPSFLGIVRVVPGEVSPDMKNDPEVERIAVNFAMDYEKKHGWTPESVEDQDLGFDIRSNKGDEVRYIEVKGRARRGPVSLTQNEQFKAQRFKNDYYLYVVLNAKTHPELYIHQNPAETLSFQEVMGVVRYIVPLDQIVNSKAVN